MAQKFTSQEDAASQLGISKDRLSQLREAGKVRGYRDGASWKFRGEDIDKLATEGIPEIDPGASDLSLESLDLGDDQPFTTTATTTDSDLSLAEEPAAPAAKATQAAGSAGESDLSLDNEELIP